MTITYINTSHHQSKFLVNLYRICWEGAGGRGDDEIYNRWIRLLYYYARFLNNLLTPDPWSKTGFISLKRLCEEKNIFNRVLSLWALMVFNTLWLPFWKTFWLPLPKACFSFQIASHNLKDCSESRDPKFCFANNNMYEHICGFFLLSMKGC